MNDTDSSGVQAATASDAPIEVLVVDDDPDYLDMTAAHLGDYEDLIVRTETDPSAALGSVGEVDCIVSDYDMPGTDGLELLSAVRDRAPDLPFVLFTGSGREDLPERVPDSTWTELLRKGDPDSTMSILARRVRRLVDHHRTVHTAKRTLTAMEATGDGIAVVDPDGTYTFVNRVFASRFGFDPDDLVGQPWQTCFPEDESDRLASTALQTVRDDWQWTGGTVCLTDCGETFTAQTRIAGLDDGSLVFCLTDSGDE
ncbi:response regulator [Halosimplex salinum]|uniref:response regulator n=1 Tax=Halosimplex salinum TaxID=1710538 RepID=UPI0013DE0953|nr:response regulator [Halosimplex salinum]